MSKLKLLELFAGSRSVGNAAEELGMQVFSIDWTPYDKIDLSIDIGELKKEHVPFVPDIIWASPDCTTYSVAALSTHRNKIEPLTEYAIKCDIVNQHWINLIKDYLQVNPDLVFFIENPRGILRNMPWMKCFKRHTVWYCKYGDDRAKPTDIWTNSKSWIPRKECSNYKYDKEGNVINKHCHHQSARRGARTGTQGRKSTYHKSQIPKELCVEILQSCLQKNKSGILWKI